MQATPLDEKVEQDSEYANPARGASSIRDEAEVAGAVHEAHRRRLDARLAAAGLEELPCEPEPPGQRRWESDIVDTYTRMTYYPQWFRPHEMELLAWKDEFVKAEQLEGVLHEPRNVLIGLPIFVAYAASGGGDS